nr:hypothetical protein GCM10010200_031370 [Actinomadura rugatobispora]
MPSGELGSPGVHGPRPKRTAVPVALCPPVTPGTARRPPRPPVAVASAGPVAGAGRPSGTARPGRCVIIRTESIRSEIARSVSERAVAGHTTTGPAAGLVAPRPGKTFPGVQGAADIGDAPGSPDTGLGWPKAADRFLSCSVPQLAARIARPARTPPARPERECAARSWVMAPPYPVIRLR